ncbi:hypothetical protein E2C01_016687 [Portunus trituberculatus]|uniref:Uncharacterized protein n=1 Tax=Portunus trituberculatus TaxID=210409 RepID=A0A5B7DQH9_PORTR|nr:hypothetical protein [Portunus trituberculatus]
MHLAAQPIHGLLCCSSQLEGGTASPCLILRVVPLRPLLTANTQDSGETLTLSLCLRVSPHGSGTCGCDLHAAAGGGKREAGV